MRVIFVVLALAAAGCEKTPPTVESGKQLAPAGEGTSNPGAKTPATVAATPHEEQAGEPMDDVDEEESPSDKSGAGDPAPSEKEGDGPEGEEIDVEE
jgi:hypothetical protein